MSLAQMTFHTMPIGRRTSICSRCGRPLTDPKSVEAGMGEICRGHANPGDRKTMNDDVATRSEFTDQFDSEIPFGKAFVMRREGKTGEVGDADNNRGVVVTNVPHLVVHHSPDGFEFGYGGSGAADLALNACQLYLNITQYTGRKTKCYDGYCWALAWRLHQEFKREFIERVNWRKGATISFEKLEVWFMRNITGELLRECMIEEIEEME